MSEVIRLLEGMHALFSDPKKFTQGALARNAWGYPVDPEHIDATCFCTIGGAVHVSIRDGMGAINRFDAVQEMSITAEGRNLIAVSDGREDIYGPDRTPITGRDAVIYILDVTLERLKGETS